MTYRRVRPALLLIAAFFAIPAHLLAQASLADPGGVEPNRDYLALLPFEKIDTATSNIILTFTDLVLPGNGGRDLRIGRVLNNGLGGC